MCVCRFVCACVVCRCRLLFSLQDEMPTPLFTLTDSLIINQPCNYTAE